MSKRSNKGNTKIITAENQFTDELFISNRG